MVMCGEGQVNGSVWWRGGQWWWCLHVATYVHP